MQLVSITVKPIRDSERVAAQLIIEEKDKTGHYKTVQEYGAVTGEASESRVIPLEDNQRLIVQGQANVSYVYDPVQAAVVRVEETELPEVKTSPPVDTGEEKHSSPPPVPPLRGGAASSHSGSRK